MSKLANKIYVKRESDADVKYYIADEDLYSLVEKGEKVLIGVYELVETMQAEAVISTSAPIKAKRKSK